MTAQSATAMQPVRGTLTVRQSSTDLLEQFDRSYNSIARRAFELSLGDERSLGHELDNWLRAEAELLFPVPIDMIESDSNFTVRAEVPGFTAKDIEIKVEPRCLRIAGKREVKDAMNGKKIRAEWKADQVLRAVDLPVDIDTANVDARLKDGILVIDLPKATYAKSIQIEPKSA